MIFQAIHGSGDDCNLPDDGVLPKALPGIKEACQCYCRNGRQQGIYTNMSNIGQTI